jgi:citrate synthase
MSQEKDVIHSRIWEEVAEPDNPFAAAACYCSGYDVYGGLLGKATWIEYLYLLFNRERPTPAEAKLLEGLAVAIANPGPRDHSVRAAMSAGVGGSTYASCLMGALAVGAGHLGGAREVRVAMEYWQECDTRLDSWRENIERLSGDSRAEVWPDMEHAPGFDPHGVRCATTVRQTLEYLEQQSIGTALTWLREHRGELESIAGHPLAMSGVAAAALVDLGFEPGEGEMLYLLLRLPGAAVHALEQEQYGWQRYPFFSNGLVLENDPGSKNRE